MDCSPSSDRLLRQLRGASARLRTVECWMDTLLGLSGTCPPPGNIYAELISRTYGSGRYTVRFRSIPERQYSIQESTDQVTWMTVGATQEAADSPAVTTDWLSPLRPSSPAFYFRVVLLPVRTYHCYTQSEDGINASSALCLFTDEIATLD